MKSLTESIKDCLIENYLVERDIDWKGSGWETGNTIQLTRNHYHDKLTPENIKAQLEDVALRFECSVSDLLKNYKLEDDVVFGTIAFHSGRITKEKYGYLKISDDTKPNQILFLEYTENKSEALELKTLGDLIDLIYQYKEVKVYMPDKFGVKYANSINIRPREYYSGTLGILKFK